MPSISRPPTVDNPAMPKASGRTCSASTRRASDRRSRGCASCARPGADMEFSQGRCAICDNHDFLTPLHGDDGGPGCCLLCRGKWHAEHGRRRKLGRIVIRAMKAFIDGGGKMKDLDDLKTAAIASDWFDLDPLGYLAGAAKTTKNEVIELTSELLGDAIKLAHPDCHPPERQELAHRVTQGLLALVPFTFAAPKPKPPSPLDNIFDRSPSEPSEPAIAIKQEPRFPCVECADSIPYFYCNACRSEHERREHEKDERRRAQHRKWYAQRKAMQWRPERSKVSTKPRNSRQSMVPVNQTQPSNLINHDLSGLQAAILVAAFTKRVPGARGCDVSRPELLAEIWGWKTRRKLRWTAEDIAKHKSDHYRAGDTRASVDTHGAFNHIPRAERKKAHASLCRALRRLEKRMLIEFVNGTMGTYSGGLVLTPHGERIARALVEQSNAHEAAA
jgi:hypothetical protein